MEWELKKVDDVEWRRDDSGFYTLISAIRQRCRKCETDCGICEDGHVRLDIMQHSDLGDVPIISFQGTAEAVRKHAMRWFGAVPSEIWKGRFSLEHAAYIGKELYRASIEKEKYIQD